MTVMNMESTLMEGTVTHSCVKLNCDRILENLPFGHKLTFWENSNENFNNIFKINFFAHLDKATIKPSCCEVSYP